LHDPGGVGWYKTQEREKFGKFTAALYRDKPTVAIVRKPFQPQASTLAGVVADPALRVVMKVGLTYGQDVVDTITRLNMALSTLHPVAKSHLALHAILKWRPHPPPFFFFARSLVPQTLLSFSVLFMCSLRPVRGERAVGVGL
jgi:hypothetical protein